jgi:ketosteroid isomerase-like protein
MGANADVIRSAWEAFGRQDLDAATADMDASGEVIVPPTLPWGGTYRGPDGFKVMIGKFMDQLEDCRVQRSSWKQTTTT